MQRTPGLLTSPWLSVPGLLLAVGAVGTWTFAILAGAAGALPASAAFMLATLGAYASFTPAHEAMHRSIARARWVNEVVGRVAALPLMGFFLPARYFHLEHHKHTNDPAMDPDFWSGRGPWWLLPFRWLTQDLHYYVLYLRRHRSRPLAERIEVAITMTAMIVGIVAVTALGHGRAIVTFWVLPARVALAVLAFAFDWLPHRPHTVTAKEDRFRATTAFESKVASAVLLGQNLHLVHHLYPAVPFYRYARVWREVVRERVQSS